MSIRLDEARPPRAKSPPRPPSQVPAPGPQGGAESQEMSPFARVLRGIGHEIAHGESVVRGALNAGGNLGAAELLALQAGVYRYSEAVDLAAKLVDRASSGVKTVIQGQ